MSTPSAYLAYLCPLPQPSNCHSSVSYSLGSAIKLQRRLQAKYSSLHGKQVWLKNKFEVKYLYT